MQNFSVLVQARPAAPPAMSTKAIKKAPKAIPAPSVTLEHVAQRRLSASHAFLITCCSHFLPRSTCEDPAHHVQDLGFVFGLQRVVQLFLAVHLDLRI